LDCSERARLSAAADAAKAAQNLWASAPEGWFENFSIHPSAAKAGNIGPEIGTAKAMPFQNRDDLSGIESRCHSFRKKKSKFDCLGSRVGISQALRRFARRF
jgi:hypothetical protein